MAYVITGLCERCGSCAEVCPEDAIFFVKDDDEWPTFYIYPENCIECASCEVECEHKAIFHEDDISAEYKDDIQKNVDYFEIGPGADQV